MSELKFTVLKSLLGNMQKIATADEKVKYFYCNEAGNWHMSEIYNDNWVVKAYPDGIIEGRGAWVGVVKRFLASLKRSNQITTLRAELAASQAEVERLREAIDFVLFNIHPSLTTEDVETIRAEMKRAKQGGAQ